MKKQLSVFLPVLLLLNLLCTSTFAAEPTYETMTLTNQYATLTVDRVRMSYAAEGGYTIYNIPADAEITVTVAGAQNVTCPLYIGASFSLMSGYGDANTGGMGIRTAECILNKKETLQRVYLIGGNSNFLEENNDWIGSSDFVCQNGTYQFKLSAEDYIGWNLTLHCSIKPAGRGHSLLNDDLCRNEDELISFVVERASPQNAAFSDVSENSFCNKSVQWAVENGITFGKTETLFAPTEPCTKGQILTFLWRASGSPEPTENNPFRDLDANHYDYKAALWANEQGLVTGSIFGASQPCTRAMAVTYLWKLAGSPLLSWDIDEASTFLDVSRDADYAPAVVWAVQHRITNGKTDMIFAPAEVCNRGQIVTFLCRDYLIFNG